MGKTIGIIGGMGPEAACDLMNKIIASTDAHTDQEHIHICLDSDPSIPDRTAAIVQNGESPVEAVVQSGLRLEKMGAQVLVMACNTIHYYYDELAARFSVPLIHIPDETAKELSRMGVKKAGILATDGTVHGGVYDRALEKYGIEPVYPDTDGQKAVMKLCYECVKARQSEGAAECVDALISQMKAKGAQVLVPACTELPLIFEKLDRMDGCVDPTRIAARAAVRLSGAKLKY